MIYKLKQNRVGRTYLGGSRIDRFTSRKFDNHGDIPHPEDWLASVTSVVNGGVSEGLGGTEDGISIKDIIGDDVLPILVKLLDSDERLVLQAHPTIKFAKENLNSDFGKTECWYFIDCEKDACVYLGFKDGVTKADWKEAMLRQNPDELLSMVCKVPVKTGDFVFVDGGIPHAIGAGCFIIELQEPSDLMVVAEKVTPSGRKLPDYRFDMNLGVDKALEIYDYTTFNEESLKNKYYSHPEVECNKVMQIVGEWLTDKFSMYALCGKTCHKPKRKYAVAVVIGGSGILCGKEAKRGDCFLIASESLIATKGDKEFTVILCE